MAIEQDLPHGARRRSFLFVAGSAVGLAVAACATDAGRRRKDRGEEAEVTPFENTVAEVARLEATLDIGDLSRFTAS
jgi:hypothetical protein